MKKDKCMASYEAMIKNFAGSLQNKIILDYGCGNGNYTVLFSKNNNKVLGVDIIDLRYKRYQKKFIFSKYDGKKLPYDSNSCDIVTSFDVIEHVEDDVNYVKEANRVLKKGGELFLATPNRTRLSNTILKLVGRGVKYPLILSEGGRLGPVVHVREYLSEELKILLEEQGFNKIKIRPFWFGLRGSINTGICYPLIPHLSQYLFVTARKK